VSWRTYLALHATLPSLSDSWLRGQVQAALTLPGTAAHSVTARPFGAPEAAEWSLPALGLGAMATACLEPDPEFTWDARHVTAIRDVLASPDLAAELSGEATKRPE
jgi:hypothetical protein